MILRRIHEPLLSQNSWIVACPRTRQGMLVDPLRDPSDAIAAAQELQVNIVRVLQTHTPSDYVCGVPEVLMRTAATALLSSGEQKPRWYTKGQQRFGPRVQFLQDGDAFQVGDIRCRAIATPGHTPGSMCVCLEHPPTGMRAMIAGDALLAGGMGAAHPDQGGQTCASVRRIAQLPEDTIVLPAHDAGSPCGAAVQVPGATNLGIERRFNRLLRAVERGDEAAVLDRLAQLDRPSYFRRIDEINCGASVTLLAQGSEVPRLEPDTFLQLLTMPGTVVVDTRSWSNFHADGVVGAVHAPLDKYFIQTVGGAVDPDEDIVCIADPKDVAGVVRALRLIGLDRIRGWVAAEDYNRLDEGLVDLTDVEEIGIRAAAGMYARGECAMVDVRSSAEWHRGRIRGATLVTLAKLSDLLAGLPRERMLVVYCRTGGRSARACSFLARRGFRCATLQGGYWPWAGRGLPVEGEERVRPAGSPVSP